MKKPTDEEEYQDYCDGLRERLYEHERNFNTKPSRLRVATAYQLARELNFPIPEWILKGLDEHIENIRQKDLEKRIRRSDQMTFKDFIKIIKSVDPVEAKKAYAKEQNIGSIDTVNKRMRRFRKMRK